MANDFDAWLSQTQVQTEQILAQKLPESSVLPAKLHEAMRYVSLGGGKRLRPLLVQAAALTGSATPEAAEAAMAAVECIHVYSLVHDDMPAMDNDSLRRGKPTCHIQYDEATALLVGDALQTLAFDLLSRPNGLSAERRLQMVQTLAQCSGSLGMAGGQAVDLANVGNTMSQTELEQMHAMKTGALIRAAVRLGGLCCMDLGEAQLAQLDEYAAKIGLAFQVIDDVLDCEADTATLGKTAGKDAQDNKPTYVKLMGLSAARAYAEQLAAQAVAALTDFGSRAERLRQIAEFVVFRQN